MALKNNEEKALNVFKEQLERRFRLQDFRVYGSKARGDDTAGSDVDVMVQLEERNPGIESDVYDLVFEINLKYDCFISVVIFDREELENGPMAESPIYRTIMREGVVY